MDVEASHVHAFAAPANFRNWLAKHHSQKSEIWLKIQKKSSGIVSVSWTDAIVEAIAWGWIDGVKKANDETSWFQRFTPRKPSSNWSKINREHAETLIADGRMQEAGLRTIAAAKSNGRWDSAYSGSSRMEFQVVFLRAIAKNATAKKTFDGLSRAKLYSIYHRLQTAKREETRQALMKKIIKALSRGEVFGLPAADEEPRRSNAKLRMQKRRHSRPA